jgi:hypothetical protein
MDVTYNFLIETAKTVMHELEEESGNCSSASSLAYLEGATQAIGRIFDYLLIKNSMPSQTMQGLELAERIHCYLSIWLKKHAIEVYSRPVGAPKVEPLGTKGFQQEAIEKVASEVTPSRLGVRGRNGQAAAD